MTESRDKCGEALEENVVPTKFTKNMKNWSRKKVLK